MNLQEAFKKYLTDPEGDHLVYWTRDDGARFYVSSFTVDPYKPGSSGALFYSDRRERAELFSREIAEYLAARGRRTGRPTVVEAAFEARKAA